MQCAFKACLYSCAYNLSGNWMGWQRWLILDVISVQPILSLNGLMDTQKLMALEYFNASSVALWEQRI
jgi:hypothetical protein